MAFSSFNSIQSAINLRAKGISIPLLSSLTGYTAGVQIIPDSSLNVVSSTTISNTTGTVSSTVSGYTGTSTYKNGKYVFSDSTPYNLSSGTTLVFARMYDPAAVASNTNLAIADFSKDQNGNNGYTSGTNQQTNKSGQVAYSGTGAPSTSDTSGNVYYGDWVQLQTPYRYVLKSIALAGRPGYGFNRYPYIMVVLGSNDGSTWKTIFTLVNNSVCTTNTAVTTAAQIGGISSGMNLINNSSLGLTSSSTAYSYYRFVTTQLMNVNSPDSNNVLDISTLTIKAV
jgi:hypothetical protein